MTLADGHNALHRTPSPPLTPAAAQASFGITVDTSAIASTLLLLHQAEQDTHRHAWPRRRQSPTVRRARSLSPSRRSPKLRHTNGRLHADSEADGADGGDESRKGDENDLMLTEQEAELLLGDLVLADPSTTTRRPRHESHSFPSSAAVDLSSFPVRNDVRRSISCVDNRESPAHAHANEAATQASASDEHTPARTPRRFKIFYRDEALRESCAKNTRRMIENAKRLHPQPTRADPSGGSSPDTDTAEPLSNQQRVTLKMLKYRKLFDRVHEIDESRLDDPSFDVLECLGVEWCKKRKPLRLEVASISNIYCLRDVFTSCGRWPTAQCFAQRIVTDFAGADTPIPRTRVIKYLYKQLTQLYDRLERPLLDGTLDDAPRVFPWTIPGTNPRKRFPQPRGRVAQRLLPSQAQPRSEHPFLRHKVIQPSKFDNVLHANTWARYVSPVPFDVLFRVRWFLLPVSDKYGNATSLQDRFCHHACRQPETYRHVFHDCRVGKPVWRAHFGAWKSLLLGIPTWTQILFGHDLKIRGQFKDHSRGIRILWTVTCAVTFHALWALRNDKKHRSIQSPPVAVTVNQVVRNIHAHVQSIRRIATVDDDLELLADLDFLQAHLYLPRHQPPQ